MEERLESDPLEETTDQLRESSDEQLEDPISSQGYFFVAFDEIVVVKHVLGY